MTVLDQNIFDGFVCTRFDSEDAICQKLSELARNNPPDGTNKYLFRGQQQRYKRPWPPEDKPTSQGTCLPNHSLTIEGLLPSDYRGLEEEIAKGIPKANLEPKYGQHIANVRALLTTYLIQCHSKWYTGAVQKWYRGLTSDKAAKLLSIGQHYGFRSCYLDVTGDWEVAVWFATHGWKNGEYLASNGGGNDNKGSEDDAVVYVFHYQKLLAAAKDANDIIGGISQPTPCGVVEILDTPAELAPRARCQSGASIFGLDSPYFLQAAILKKAVECWSFKRGSKPAGCNCLAKQHLVPPYDEMANLYQGLHDPCNRRAAQDWVARNYPDNAPQDCDFDELFACKPIASNVPNDRTSFNPRAASRKRFPQCNQAKK